VVEVIAITAVREVEKDCLVRPVNMALSHSAWNATDRDRVDKTSSTFRKTIRMMSFHVGRPLTCTARHRSRSAKANTQLLSLRDAGFERRAQFGSSSGPCRSGNGRSEQDRGGSASSRAPSNWNRANQAWMSSRRTWRCALKKNAAAEAEKHFRLGAFESGVTTLAGRDGAIRARGARRFRKSYGASSRSWMRRLSRVPRQ
jgi:hypothetical protein